MTIFLDLENIWLKSSKPILLRNEKEIFFSNINETNQDHLSQINQGDVVALIGDFEIQSISNLLYLMDRGAIIMPLTIDTIIDHEYFFESGHVDWVVSGNSALRRKPQTKNSLIEVLRLRKHSGLILFSTGTTGRPKAILHDFSFFLERFKTPRPTLRTLSFLLFDHIGGLNTFFHTLYNGGTTVSVTDRNVDQVLEACRKHNVEALPASPTFLRMMLYSGLIPEKFPECVKIITYGTERMEQSTLETLCKLLPAVDFRQTYGMSELGILRVKSESRNSLYMQIGGEGVQSRIIDGKLEIKSKNRMLGYLNAPDPFKADDWYPTGDLVEQKGPYISILGRDSEFINVGGLKFLKSDLENRILNYPGIKFIEILVRRNPITGQHVELEIEPISEDDFDINGFQEYLAKKLPDHMRPRRVILNKVAYNHRFKRH